jgi:hypothetical protein
MASPRIRIRIRTRADAEMAIAVRSSDCALDWWAR